MTLIIFSPQLAEARDQLLLGHGCSSLKKQVGCADCDPLEARMGINTEHIVLHLLQPSLQTVAINANSQLAISANQGLRAVRETFGSGQLVPIILFIVSSLLVELSLKAIPLGTEPSTLLNGHFAILKVITQTNIDVNDLLDDIILGHIVLLMP